MSKLWKQLNKSTRNNLITIGVIIIFYLICQVMIAAGAMSYLMQGLLIPICYYAIMAVSLNLTVGILGELSLGHAGFMCVGAVTGAIFTKCMENVIEITFIRFTLAIIVGAIAAALFGALIGVVVLRLRGDYLAIVTLAFGEIIKNIMIIIQAGVDKNGFHFSIDDKNPVELVDDGKMIIDGAKGIGDMPKDTTFTAAIFLLIIIYLVVSNLIHSRSGRAIMAIRDNRIAAESVGIDITKFKILAFTISASMAGVAGVLFSHNMSPVLVTSKNFGYNQSILILVFVVLGGIGNMRGSIIAAMILTVLPSYLLFLSDYRMLIYSLVLIAMMIFNWNPTCVAWRKNHPISGLFAKKVKKEA